MLVPSVLEISIVGKKNLHCLILYFYRYLTLFELKMLHLCPIWKQFSTAIDCYSFIVVFYYTSVFASSPDRKAKTTEHYSNDLEAEDEDIITDPQSPIPQHSLFSAPHGHSQPVGKVFVERNREWESVTVSHPICKQEKPINNLCSH